MTRATLGVLLVLLLPVFGAPQQARKRRPPAPPRTSAADIQSFDQTYELLFLQAGKSFLQNEAMPDPRELDGFLAALKEPDLSKGKARRDKLEELVSRAECVQAGPGNLSREVYALGVDQMADDLDAGAIVEQEFLPNARAGRSLDAGEKALVKACQGEARNQAYDRRGFYKRCLGRLRAEGAYLDLSDAPPPSSPQAAAPACLRLLDAVAVSLTKLPNKTGSEVDERIQKVQSALMAQMTVPADMTPAPPTRAAPSTGGRKAPSQDPGGVKSSASDKMTDVGLSPPPLTAGADLKDGDKLARITRRDEIGFTGYCYSYVKSALQKMGVVDRSTLDTAGAGAHAKQFRQFVEKNPALLKRKLLKLPRPAWPLPIGAIVIWSPRACNYNAVSGHIEIVTRIKPPQACSDGCGGFQTACLDELGSDPDKAAAELPAAQQALAQAEAGNMSAKTADRAAKKSAAASLAKTKAAVAKIEERLQGRVAVYVIERK